MQLFRLITLSLFLNLVGCSRTPDTGILNERLSSNSASIFEGFYLNSPHPYKLSRSRVNRNYDYVKANYPLIFQKVSRAFPESKLVVAYLLLDSDRDGKLDWVFDEQSNSLVSFDEDIDGDGVDNYLDLDPFDSSVSFQDKNENEFPDHLESEDLKILAIQLEFLNKYQVYVINQSSYHTLKSLVAFRRSLSLGLIITPLKVLNTWLLFRRLNTKGSRFSTRHSKLIGVTNLGRKQSENKVFRSKVSMSFYGTVFMSSFTQRSIQFSEMIERVMTF